MSHKNSRTRRQGEQLLLSTLHLNTQESTEDKDFFKTKMKWNSKVVLLHCISTKHWSWEMARRSKDLRTQNKSGPTDFQYLSQTQIFELRLHCDMARVSEGLSMQWAKLVWKSDSCHMSSCYKLSLLEYLVPVVGSFCEPFIFVLNLAHSFKYSSFTEIFALFRSLEVSRGL